MKIRTLMLFVFLNSLPLCAVPASPFPVTYMQPDDSSIVLYLRGDERVSWAETSDGYVLLPNNNGWEYAVTDNVSKLKPSGMIARESGRRTLKELQLLQKIKKSNFFSSEQIESQSKVWNQAHGFDQLMQTKSGFLINRKSNPVSGKQKVFTPLGQKKLLMILIQFPDVPFTRSIADFQNLMNTPGYNQNNAEGSLRDYFLEISYGQFDVSTDVAGIYTADYNMEYYGAPNGTSKDIRPRDLMREALLKANPDVDYSQYDNDGDGTVDGVYIIYAGFGEASSAIPNTIWPHAGTFSDISYDNKQITRYSCSNELNTNGTLTTIGVICHEFGHVCGAPDYYDTNGTTGGSFTGNGYWDLMDVGLYNKTGTQSGNKPAHLNPLEKIRAGWLSPVLLNNFTTVSLPDVTFNPAVYLVNTKTSDEYYLLENRQKTGFNAGCRGNGLMIYHYSKIYWNAGANKTAPQGFYPVCAGSGTSPTLTSDKDSYGLINSAACPFPGSALKTAFTDFTIPTAKSWDGSSTEFPIRNIAENSGIITFEAGYRPLSWNGQTNTDWFNVTNWSGGVIPDLYSNVSIDDAVNPAVIAGANAFVNQLVIEEDAVLNIAPTGSLTANGSVVNNAGAGSFVLESDADNQAEFAHLNENTSVVPATVQQYLQSGRNWYVSAPVSGASVGTLSGAGSVVSYHEPTASWVAASGNFIPMKGYIATSMQTNVVISFQGNLNDGDLSVGLTQTPGVIKSGFNLVANPYPSYLNWDEVIKLNVESSIWYRTKNASGSYVFDTYNALSKTGTGNGGATVNAHIPPMQAFWVKVDALAEGNTGSLVVNNSMRRIKGSQITDLGEISDVKLRLKGDNASSMQLLRIMVTGKGGSDEAILTLNEKAINDRDVYDSYKMMNTAQIPEIYTFINQDKLVINSLNANELPVSVPLGVYVRTPDSLTILVKEAKNLQKAGLALYDKYFNKYISLDESSRYTFFADKTTDDRFEILFGAQQVLSDVEEVGVNTIPLVRFSGDRQELKISNPTTETVKIQIFDLTGKLIFRDEVVESGKLNHPLKAGVYIVEISADNKSLKQKIIL